MRHRQKTDQEKKIGLVVGLILVAIVFILVGRWLANADTEPKTTFRAEVANVNPISSSKLIAAVKITNTGGVSDTPSCYIQADGDSPEYHGSDYFTFGEVKPGQTGKFGAELIITNNGANQITKASITC